MITELTISNWGPFRGRHTIQLGPGAIAIVAAHEDDRLRSNAVGKSMLLEAVDYALTGRLNKNRGFDSDGWITRGEREGSVRVTLEDGSWVERSKRRGQSRQVRVQLPGRELAAQDAGHVVMLKHLAFDEDDFRRASYFEQKEAARLLRADPSERLTIVSSWLGLGLADRAEDRAAQIASERWQTLARLDERRATLERHFAPIETEEEIAKTRTETEKLRVLVAELEEQIDAVRAAERAREIINAHGALVADGKEVRAWVDNNEKSITKEGEKAAKELAARTAELGEAQADLDRRKAVAAGDFDGHCPVGGIACPVTDLINADRVTAKALYQTAKEKHAEVSAAAQKARDRDRRARDDAGKLASNKRRLERLREEVKENLTRVEEAKKVFTTTPTNIDGDELRTRLTEAREHLAEHEALIRTHERAKEIAGRDAEALAQVRADLASAVAKHKTAHLTREVFRLARRRVAERAIGEIEEDANEAIAAAGVDLRLGVRWEREGKKPAIECSECGAPFPASAKVKECGRCGSPRGMHSIPRLDFVLSDSSGGYDDLAGIALQLSAGAWLLRARQSPWSCALLDEPTSAFDAAVRRGFVRYLGGLTSRGGFRQLIVIAHQSDTVDAIPRRITIVKKPNGERAIVS